MTVARADAGQAKTDPTPASVVTLVHGTFARGSRWRDLERRLQSTLPAPVIFEYFEWTGGFTVRARARASIELREKLRHRFAQHDRADHYIVAHSHGGNVVLSALDPNVAGSEFSKRVKMVICLSTPFLTVYPRASRAPEYFAVLGLLAWSFVALRDRPALFLWAALPLVIALALVLFELRSRANRIASTMWRDVSASLPLRVLRSAADEAALILALAQAITGVLRRLVDALVAIPRGAERFALWTWEAFGDVLLALARPEAPLTFSGTGLLILPLSMLGLALSTWLAFTYDWPYGIRWIAAGLLALVTTPIWVSALVIVPLLLASTIVAPLIFIVPWPLFLLGGGQLVLAGTFLNVVVEPSPAGTWIVHQLPWPSAEGALVLRHSASYGDPRALQQIHDWLVECQAQTEPPTN